MTTDRKLVAAAAALLDSGGEQAVTLRAVGSAVGVSHNAPYKHFANRDALLGAVAAGDFRGLRDAFTDIRRSPREPMAQLDAALDHVIAFGRQHTARYRLLFSSPTVAAQGEPLRGLAAETFRAFVAIVEGCQAVGALPAVPSDALAVVVFSTAHGLIDSDTSGRLKPAESDDRITTRSTLTLLLRLLSTSTG